MTDREKRLVTLGGVAALAILGYWAATRESDAPVVEASASVADIQGAEQRLTRLRQMTASVPAREQVLAGVQKELAVREQGLLQAETVAQAQAQVLQILRRVSAQQPQPIQIRNFEPGQIRPLGEDYGEVLASVSMDCRPEQLVNLLADLTTQKELIATSEIRVGMAHQKEKVMPVRLTVSAVVPKRLLPERKGADPF
jgi:hypothetical protein